MLLSYNRAIELNPKMMKKLAKNLYGKIFVTKGYLPKALSDLLF
jgi:hypothetical protein